MTTALDRDALYYPYIHFRDVQWLKATLLCFPQVRRIVPDDFHLNDSEEVQRLRKLEGSRGRLIAQELAMSPPVAEAQQRLLTRFQGLSQADFQRFTQAAVAAQHGGNTEAFQMHRGKLEPLADFLLSQGLAWPSGSIGARRPGEWLALAPRLGEAVMSTVAIAIARDKGLDIVTSERRVHRALSDLDEDGIFAELTGIPARPRVGSPDRVAEVTDELVHTLLLTTFDVSRLTIEQIAELNAQGNDLRRFKSAVAGIVGRIPDIQDPEELDRRLKDATAEVVENWQKHRSSLPRFALDALVSAATFNLPGIATGLLDAGSTTAYVGAGLGIFFTAHAASRALEDYRLRRDSPFQYLTRVEKAGAIALGLPARKTIRAGLKELTWRSP